MSSKTLAIVMALVVFLHACAPVITATPLAPTETAMPTLTDTAVPATSTSTPTLLPVLTSTNSSCQLDIRGTYNYSNTDTIFKLGPGRTLFYDEPGGGSYSNDQAGCELNYDCTQLRAINKDSEEPNPEGVIGSWVDVQTGTSTAQWQSYIVQCSLAPVP
jgi:hypothetical protein